MTPHKYTYPARCTNVVDGDTIDVTLDLGLHLTSTQRVRLLGVNCPELHTTNPQVRTNVIDGDTIDVTLDLGLHLTSTQRVRLLGVNCPELHATNPEVRTAAIDALIYTRATIDEWQNNTTLKFPLLITTTKTDAFGRWLADVESAMFHTDTLSNELLTAGHAVAYTRKKV